MKTFSSFIFIYINMYICICIHVFNVYTCNICKPFNILLTFFFFCNSFCPFPSPQLTVSNTQVWVQNNGKNLGSFRFNYTVVRSKVNSQTSLHSSSSLPPISFQNATSLAGFWNQIKFSQLPKFRES